MEEIDKLRQGFLNQAHAGGPPAFYDAEVTAVDPDEYTCDVLVDEVPVYGVRLRAVVSNNQSIDVLPVEGSQVMLGMIAADDYIVLACDEISSYRVKVGGSVLTIDSTGTLISNGDETLKKILTDLVNGVLTIAAAKDVPGITELLLRINTLLK